MIRMRALFRARGDDGFSLLESVVALAIAGVIFTALAAASLSSLKAVLVGRTVQQAGDVAEQAMESMRAFGYDNLVMKDSDLGTNDPLGLTTTSKYDATTNTVSTSGEPIVHDPAGPISPHVLYVTPNNGSKYTVRKYVTQVTDSTASNGTQYKRLTVVVTWTTRGVPRTRILSSLLTAQRSGLPLPDYKFIANGQAGSCVTPGADGTIGFRLSNNGARDSWAISSSGGSQTWSYYLDDGTTTGSWDSSDSAVPAPGGTPTVGPIDPTKVVNFWARTSTNTSTPVGSSTVTFTATSVAQPAYHSDVPTTFQVAAVCTTLPTPTPTASPTSTATPTPTPSPTTTDVPPTQPITCAASSTLPSPNPGGSATSRTYYMPNGVSNLGNTAATSPLTMNKVSAPSSSTLWNYSTDLSTSAGRYLGNTGSTLATTADWRYQFTTATKLVGTGTVTLWGMAASGSPAASLGFTVTVDRLNSAGVYQETITTSTLSPSVWGCTGMKPFGFSIGFGGGNGTSFSANDLISIKVTAQGVPAVIAYDTTTYSAATVLPVKSGG